MTRVRRALAAAASLATAAIASALLVAAPASAVSPSAPAGFAVHGFDVSDYSDNAETRFGAAKADGAGFVYVKAGSGEFTGGVDAYASASTFTTQWYAAGPAGLPHGAYYVAAMGDKTQASNPVTQANLFVDATVQQLTEPGSLPPLLDLEGGESTQCWMLDDAAWQNGLAANQARMIAWIAAFSQTVQQRIGRLPLIYTSPDWWNTCTGGSAQFRANGLFIASYGGAAPVLPAGWTSYVFWQWNGVTADAPRPAFPGDQDVFNGTAEQLAGLAGGILAPTPKISGTAKVGATLTAVPGAWSPGVTLSYRWFANGKPIAGATGSKLVLKAAQYKAQIRVKVTGSKAGATPVTVVSGHSANVAAGKLRTTAVRLAGTPRVGSYLAAKKGAWTSGTKFAYRWYANGRQLKNTKPSLKLTSALRGKTLVVKVTGTRTGYAKATVASAKSGKVR